MASTRAKSPLDDIRVASPCEAPWERMEGTDRVRFCGSCRLHVYDLSALPRTEAEKLVREKEGRLCVRFFRRADGTMLTADCPVGVAALRRRMMRLAAVLAASLGLASAAGSVAASGAAGRAWPRAARALRGILPSRLLPAPPPPPLPRIMGVMAPPPVQGTPAPLPPAGGAAPTAPAEQGEVIFCPSEGDPDE